MRTTYDYQQPAIPPQLEVGVIAWNTTLSTLGI